MGELIGAKAAVRDVEEAIRSGYGAAVARKGAVAAAAEGRLGPTIAAIDVAVEVLSTARAAEAAAWAPVLACDHDSDQVIGATRDAMWNRLDRPQRHPQMDHVFPGGVATYTAGDPTRQPILMQVLESRIQTATAAPWTAELKAQWIADLAAKRTAQAAAVEAHRPADAALTLAEAGYRAAVRAGHAQLAKLKRELKLLDLTEAQIHEIIPEVTTATRRVKAEPAAPG